MPAISREAFALMIVEVDQVGGPGGIEVWEFPR